MKTKQVPLPAFVPNACDKQGAALDLLDGRSPPSPRVWFIACLGQDVAFRLLFESCLCEMLVEGESCSDSKPLHHKERGTIREGIRFIRVLNEVVPRLPKETLVYLDQSDRRAFD